MKEQKSILEKKNVSVQLSFHVEDKGSFQQEDRMTVLLILAARKLDQWHIFCWRRNLILVAKFQNQSSEFQACPLSQAGSIMQFVHFN